MIRGGAKDVTIKPGTETMDKDSCQAGVIINLSNTGAQLVKETGSPHGTRWMWAPKHMKEIFLATATSRTAVRVFGVVLMHQTAHREEAMTKFDEMNTVR